MKTCQCCGTVSDAATCPRCGEASWAPVALPVEVKPAFAADIAPVADAIAAAAPEPVAVESIVEAAPSAAPLAIDEPAAPTTPVAPVVIPSNPARHGGRNRNR